MIRKSRLLISLSLSGLAILLVSMLASCGKDDATTANSSNVRLLIANLSHDLYPVSLYINNVRQNSTNYGFNSTPAYFNLGTTNQALQIRSTRSNDAATNLLFTLRDTLRSDRRYSIFVIGTYADTIMHIFTVDDTTQLAPTGQGGKIRFVNGSPNSPAFDVWANGTVAFKNSKFASVSPYLTLPAGSYTFKMYSNGTSTADLATLQNVTIQDGRLYTLYSRGVINRVDSAKLALNYITNY